MTKLVTRGLRLLVCASMVAALAPAGHAQFKASIGGTVKDAAGAVVSGVNVTVTNTETGKSQQAVTGDEGFFRVSGLPPGIYIVTADASGFKKKVVEDLVLHAEETQGINITLEAGQVSESVTISANTGGAGQVHTENANVDRSITNREILRIPQSGRDPYELIRMTPGVFGDGARGGAGQAVNLPNTTGPGGSNTSIFQVENQVPISANGQRVSANNFQIDGVSVNSLEHGGAAVVTPNQESVKEIQVLSSSYSAEDGRNTGAQIKVVSQNGTNEFHGSALFKYDDPDFNAFNKFGGTTGDPTKNAPPVRVNQLFRQFAGSLGGPIIKNKLFFFFSYEGLRNSSTNTSDAWVETPQFRQLVISQRAGGATAQVFGSPGIEPRIISVLPADCSIFGNDPNRCRVVPGGLDIGSLTGATGQYVSLGNPVGGGFDGVPDVQFVRLAVPASTRPNQYNTRIDFNRGTADQFAVSTYFTTHNDSSADAAGKSRPMADLAFKPRSSAATVTWIRSISSSMLNEARANFTRFTFDQVSTNQDVNFGIPRIEVEGLPFDRIRFGADRSETTPAKFAENTFEVRDVLSKVFGVHAMKAGIEIRKEQNNNSLVGGARPLYSFVGLFNLANGTPIFEAINADPRSGLPADAQRYFRTSTYAGFVQDDWKIKYNLTLNIGLRYEYFTPLRETQDRISNLVFPAGQLATSQLVGSDELFNPDRNNFAPRFGFAWSPAALEQKFVLRGGFGVSYNRTPQVLFGNTRGNPPFFARYNICCGTSSSDFGTPFVDGKIAYVLGASQSPFSYPINPALAQGIDPATGGVKDNTVEIWATPPNFPNAYVYNFSLDTEYQLPYHLVAALGYQGSSSHKLIRIVDETLILPTNPRFDPVFFLTPDVNANYHAMLFRLSKALSHGFRIDSVYRWSKSIDTLSFEGPGALTNQTNPGDLASERGPSDFDVRHLYNLSGTWDLPIFRTRTDWIGRLLGGWQLNGIWTKHSGFPFTPKIFQSLRQPSGKFFGPIRPTQYFGGAGDSSSDSTFTSVGGNFPGGGAKYFDTTTVGPPGIGRNSFRGPKYSAVDLSFAKQTGFGHIRWLGEGANIELRVNLFNAFNQLNLLPIQFFDAGAIVTDPNFGRSSGGLSGRVMELQARFSF
jgi:Carboxypeptidase regulatory-like domain/TonB dependent receptor-like, beta-barrel